MARASTFPFSKKTHSTLLELLTSHLRDAPLPPNAAVLRRDGNCIPLGLWRLLDSHRPSILETASRDSLVNRAAASRGVRSYSECWTEYGLCGTPHLGFEPAGGGDFLLHVEDHGRPHCIPVRVDAGRNTVLGWHAEGSFEMLFRQFADMCLQSVDSKTLLCFQRGPQGAPPASIYTDDVRPGIMERMHDLLAGAGERDSCVEFRHADATLPYEQLWDSPDEEGGA